MVISEIVSVHRPVGLYEVQKSLFPHNAYEMQQKQLEYATEPNLGAYILINGKAYSTSNIAEKIIEKEEKMEKQKKEEPPDEPDE